MNQQHTKLQDCVKWCIKTDKVNDVKDVKDKKDQQLKTTDDSVKDLKLQKCLKNCMEMKSIKIDDNFK